MPDDIDPFTNLPEHIQEAVRASALFHAEHDRRASHLTRSLNSVTNHLGRPTTIPVFLTLTAVWMVANITLPLFAVRAFDVPPFSLLETILTVLSVLTTFTILTTQIHTSELSEVRAKLTLELAILSEQKSAKIIEMLDALRRDLPNVTNTSDPTVAALSTPSPPQTVLETLEETRRLVDGQIAGENSGDTT